jgi:hypothetical protein
VVVSGLPGRDHGQALRERLLERDRESLAFRGQHERVHALEQPLKPLRLHEWEDRGALRIGRAIRDGHELVCRIGRSEKYVQALLRHIAPDEERDETIRREAEGAT